MAKSRPTAVTGRSATDEVGDGELAPDEHEGDEIVLRRRGSVGEPSGGVTCESGAWTRGSREEIWPRRQAEGSEFVGRRIRDWLS